MSASHAHDASPDDDENGLKIVLSPIQLSAILQGKSISEPETIGGRFFNRAVGTLEIIAGAVQIVSGIALVALPDPTLLTKVAGSLLGGHGADDFYVGVAQAWTGETANTLSYGTVKAGCEALGCRPEVAGMAGVIADIAVPTSIAGYLKAVRIYRVRGGLIDLQEEEALESHAIARHVGKSDEYLLGRVQSYQKTKKSGKVITKQGVPGAGTYRNLKEAEIFTSAALRKNKSEINAWIKSGCQTDLKLTYDNKGINFFEDYSVGYGVKRGSAVFEKTTKVKITLKGTNVNGKKYLLITSFPDVAE
ncbi:hypothetical protein A0U92_07235 [Acetobacter aceti]|uniref:Bacterial CdiA-CT RNAse A domain-containing protein n=1 Tax=Acetobacter aceti TaxID=435 RepID=A0A1U9KFP4_ACEAC|nr:RNase A-like domain-containing protein [Acetobacter aceti]AQS84606.1 hypothetical protein A0U92_07235 [Acetobacter aceti]